MPRFTDDDGKPVNAVTAEQHVLNNQRHVVIVQCVATPNGCILKLQCVTCEWWDHQGDQWLVQA